MRKLLVSMLAITWALTACNPPEGQISDGATGVVASDKAMAKQEKSVARKKSDASAVKTDSSKPKAE